MRCKKAMKRARSCLLPGSVCGTARDTSRQLMKAAPVGEQTRRRHKATHRIVEACRATEDVQHPADGAASRQQGLQRAAAGWVAWVNNKPSAVLLYPDGRIATHRYNPTQDSTTRQRSSTAAQFQLYRVCLFKPSSSTPRSHLSEVCCVYTGHT